VLGHSSSFEVKTMLLLRYDTILRTVQSTETFQWVSVFKFMNAYSNWEMCCVTLKVPWILLPARVYLTMT